MYNFKTENVYEGFSTDKEMFDFSNHSIKSKYYYNLNKLVVGEMNDQTGGVTIKVFVELKPKMYSFLVDDLSEHEKANVVMLL